MKHKKLEVIFKILTLITLVFSTTNCISLSSHQTGRTLGKNNTSTITSFNRGQNESNSYFKDYILPLDLEFGLFYGKKENLDLGIKINTSSHITGTSKYQFLGNKKSFYASSIGANIGVGFYDILFDVLSYSSSISLYNSFHPTNFLALTFTPKYTFFGFTHFKEKKLWKTNIFGYSAGIIIGKKHQLSLEFSKYVTNKAPSFSGIPILSLGYIYNSKPKSKIKPTSN